MQPALFALSPHPLAALARFAPISLDEMDAVALQNRTDTKYLLRTDQLAQALRALVGRYRVLTIDGVRLSPYQTVYFDTPAFALYLQHHAGRGSRVKVRGRRYAATGQSFFEVKRKTPKGRTVKRRVATDGLATAITPATAGLLAEAAIDPASLAPSLGNTFARITLVSTTWAERLTIDLDLRFRGGGRQIGLPGIAVAEVKQAGVDRASAFIQQMHAMHIRPTGFSKYCIGAALLYPDLKHNAFKPKLRLVQHLMGANHHDR